MKQLEELLSGTFCIVGNSPKELGTGNGPLIDSYDTIIRFKNYDLSGEYAKDYGTRTTVMVSPFNKTQFYRDTKQYECVCCCIPLNNKVWRKKYSKHINFTLLQRYCDEKFLQYIPLDIFNTLRETYPNGQPSSGMMTLWWIYNIIGRCIPRSDIFGFSMFDPKESHHYYKNHIRLENPNKKISGNTRRNLERTARMYKSSTKKVHPRKYEMRTFNKCSCE